MIYFDFGELAVSCIYAFLFGVLTAGIYTSLYKICTYIFLLARLPIDALIADSGKCAMHRHSKKSKHRRLISEIFDFVFFALIGAVYILLLYVSLDGIPRIHFFILSLFGFILSRATMGKFFTAAFDVVLSWLYKLSFYITYTSLTPLRLLRKMLSRALRPICVHASEVIAGYKYNRLLRKKMRDTKRIMNKLCNPANNFF